MVSLLVSMKACKHDEIVCKICTPKLYKYIHKKQKPMKLTKKDWEWIRKVAKHNTSKVKN